MNFIAILKKRLKSYYKFVYFLFRNRINYADYDFSQMTEQEFLEKFLKGKKRKLENLKKWETSEEYQSLLLLKEYSTSIQDFLEIYNVVKERAKQGNDDKAIKLFIELQKQLRLLVQDVPFGDIEDDDGLILD